MMAKREGLKWRTPFGEMPLPDDLPSKVILKNGQIDWQHSKSGLVNAYIKKSYFDFANLSGRNFIPQSFKGWSSGLEPRLRFFLSRPQRDVERLEYGAHLWKYFRQDIGIDNRD